MKSVIKAELKKVLENYNTLNFENEYNSFYRNNVNEVENFTNKVLEKSLTSKQPIEVVFTWIFFKENIIDDLIWGKMLFELEIWNYLPKTVKTEIAQYVLDFWVYKKETTHKDCKFIYDFIREEKIKANSIDNAFAETDYMSYVEM